ncbi:MAG: CoA transferase [Dehalococcoidia bacterium]|nr:CoA transferase [Dehalococcoidia bacterium]
MTLPLGSVVVLDLADEPMVLASRLLADLGADVIRVEPIGGDGVRRRGPFVGGIEGLERGLAHIRYNAGKRSLALALDRPEAWEAARALASRADIAIVPMEADALTGEFVAEAHLGAVSPGPGVIEAVLRRDAAREPVADLVGVAAGGMLYLNGYPEDPPNHPAGQLAYKQTSLAAALGAVSLLLESQAGRRGCRIVVSMQEAMMWTTIQSGNQNYWHWYRQRPRRRGLANVGMQTIFRARDGKWVSFYQHPPAWGRFAAWAREALGESRFEAPEWHDAGYRLEQHAQVVAVTARLCESLDCADLVAEAQRRAILVVPVQGVMDIARDPHLRARGFFQKVWHEQLGMDIEVMRPPFVSSAYAASARPAPALGEHTRSVLKELCGFEESKIDRWLRDGLAREATSEVLAR